MNAKQKKTCFFVTPIGNLPSDARARMETLRDHVIFPAIGQEYDIEVGHTINESGSINTQVLERLVECDLIITDLTRNFNVGYETAIRHMVNSPTVHLSPPMERPPFDIGDARTIVIDDNDPYSFASAIQSLQAQVRHIETHRANYCSPLYPLIKQIMGSPQKSNGYRKALASWNCASRLVEAGKPVQPALTSRQLTPIDGPTFQPSPYNVPSPSVMAILSDPAPAQTANPFDGIRGAGAPDELSEAFKRIIAQGGNPFENNGNS